MGYELYRHVLNHAPDELDASARLVLAVIADDAHEKTRKSYLGMGLLSHRTGLLPDSIGKALRRLAKSGVEIRVPVGTDKRGRPVFAMKGHRTVYLIPVFPERFMAPKDCPQADLSEGESPDEKQTKDGSKPGREAAKVGSEAAKAGREADPPPQSPQSPHSFSPENDSNTPSLDEKETENDVAKTPKKKTSAPDDFVITDAMRAWAKDRVPNVDIDFETEQFLDTHAAKGNKFLDWNRAWHTWMRNARRFAEERQQNGRGNLRVVGGSRAPVADADFYNAHTDEELKARFLS